MTAKFKHDCTECIFLGQFEETNKIYDLYFCKEGGLIGPTVIARYGNEGYEYMSGMRFADDKDSMPLYEAKQRAISQGLLK